MSTFKAPTPRNQNLKNLESHRVVFFRKSAGGESVNFIEKSNLTADCWAVTIMLMMFFEGLLALETSCNQKGYTIG